jgi:hypothetical protein
MMSFLQTFCKDDEYGKRWIVYVPTCKIHNLGVRYISFVHFVCRLSTEGIEVSIIVGDDVGTDAA